MCLSIENTSFPGLDVEVSLLVSKEDSLEAVLLDTAQVVFRLTLLATTYVALLADSFASEDSVRGVNVLQLAPLGPVESEKDGV